MRNNRTMANDALTQDEADFYNHQAHLEDIRAGKTSDADAEDLLMRVITAPIWLPISLLIMAALWIKSLWLR